MGKSDDGRVEEVVKGAVEDSKLPDVGLVVEGSARIVDNESGKRAVVIVENVVICAVVVLALVDKGLVV